jgi:NADP-dependent 3-hydroxy acid dehydrogenase YdfG
VSRLFAEKRYSNVALIARRAEQLQAENKALKEVLGDKVSVETFALDVTDSDALLKALDDAEATFGQPEVIFYNAARVLPSTLLDHDVNEIDYDFKVRLPPSTTSPVA